MCACEHVIITTAIVFTFLFFVLIFSATLFMSNDFQKSQTLSLFQVGEHSIEIIIKDEQLNVTPNFYTYDSSKIKVPQKFSTTTTTTQKESKCWTWPKKYRLGPFHKATSASQLNLTVSFFLFLHLFHPRAQQRQWCVSTFPICLWKLNDMKEKMVWKLGDVHSLKYRTDTGHQTKKSLW